jgi:hypothetical protein
VRSAAAGGIVTLGSRFDTLAQLIGAEIGPEAKVSWPHATTYLGPHPGLDRVVLQHDFISTPRHEQVQVRPITGSEERYVRALPKKS